MEVENLVEAEPLDLAKRLADDVVQRRSRARGIQSLFQSPALLSLGIAVLPPFLIGGMGAVATNASVSTWYRTLKKPSWNPPDWVFGPVWTGLYLTMGLASWLVWRKRETEEQEVDHALKWYAAQLSFNSLWSPIFFGLRRVDLALVDLAALWGVLLTCLLKFTRIRPVAGLLLVPYLLWVSFAFILNTAVWWLNRRR